ncbi:MAG: cysteine--tRNA ligase [Pseudomonadota bacterium]
MASILDMIGNTPLVDIKRMNSNPRVSIMAKLEYFNPGGSMKDRIALSMILAGEASNELTHDKIVLEATSGNTGIGLAMICNIKGYRLVLAMPESASLERRKILKAMGAELLLTPARLGTDGAIEEVYRLVREKPNKYFMTDQYNNDANWLAHYKGTAEEIWRQTDGLVTVVAVTLGTSGSAMGISRRLKEYDPGIRIIAGEPYLGHKIQGLKNMKEAYRPGIYQKERLDKTIYVEDDDAFEMTRRLAREEGLFVGMSSGAAMVVACQVAAEMTEGVLVAIFPDSGERYLSTQLFEVKEKSSFRFYNTMTRSKESFTPIRPGEASIYSCGPTVDNLIDIGHARRFVMADILRRYLEYKGYKVSHVMNITDLDDRTIEGANQAGMNLKTFTEKYIQAFFEDIEALGIKQATVYPRASEHVEDMVELARKLLEKGVAYEKLRSVYFDISRFPGYGRLSRIDFEKIKLGATTDLDDYAKDNPRDFTLLKRARLSDLRLGLYTPTDWGNVRPSWHIECAAMAMKYLGESFDIHTSSQALVFPHHENEIAICESITGKPLANYWLHSGHVLVDGDESGHGRTRRLTVRQLIEGGHTGRELRFWLVSHHYRKPLYFNKEVLKQAGHALGRLDDFVAGLQEIKGRHIKQCQDVDQLVYDLKQGFVEGMDDDLNVSSVFAALFRFVKKVNELLAQERLDCTGADAILDALYKIDSVLNILNLAPVEFPQEIKDILKERSAARNSRDFKRADDLRDLLHKKGFIVRDTRYGAQVVNV